MTSGDAPVEPLCEAGPEAARRPGHLSVSRGQTLCVEQAEQAELAELAEHVDVKPG